MLNPQVLLRLAADALAARAMPGPGVYALLYRNGNLLCVRRKTVVDEESIIATFANASLNTGFNTEQWNSLEQKLADFFKDHEQCPKVQRL